MRKLTTLAIILFAFALPAAAQEPVPEVGAGAAFSIAFEHDAVDTTGYRIKIDDVQVGPNVPLTALQDGTATIEIPGVAAGTRVLTVEAFGPGGVGSASLKFFAKPAAPSAPLNLRIIITADENGVLQFKLENAQSGG